MEVLIKFPLERVSRNIKPHAGKRKSTASAKILFFSGVRYSAMLDPSPAMGTRRNSSSTHKRRR